MFFRHYDFDTGLNIIYNIVEIKIPLISEANRMKKQTALFLVALGNVIWGASFMFSKIAMEYTEPVSLLALRFVFAFASMSLLSLLFHNNKNFRLDFRGKNIKPLIILSFFQPIAYFFFEANGIKLTNSVLSSVIIATIPIVTLFFEAFKLKQKLPKDKLFFSCLSVGGVIIVSFCSSSGGKNSLLGIVSLLLAVVTSIGFNYMSKLSSGSFSAYERSYFMFMSGAVFYFITAIIKNGFNLRLLFEPLHHTEFLWAILYLGVISSVAAFTFINAGLEVLSLSETTVFNTLITMVGVLCGTFILKEAVTPLKLLGCAVIIAGLLGFNRNAKEN